MEVKSSSHSADLSHIIIGRDGVVSSSLDVYSGQIQGNLCHDVEEALSDRVRYSTIRTFEALHQHSSDYGVNATCRGRVVIGSDVISLGSNI